MTAWCARRRRRSRERLGRVVTAALVLGACSSGASKPSSPTPTVRTTTTLSPAERAANDQAKRDTHISSCSAGVDGKIVITGTVRNSSALPGTFTIQLRIDSKSGKALFFTAAAADPVAAHATARWSARTGARFEPGMGCVVTSVALT